MLGFNTEIEKSQKDKKRIPRIMLLNTQDLEDIKTVQGALLMMPDQTHLPIVSMNFAGISISPIGYVNKLRLGQALDCKLKVQGMWSPIELRLKVVKISQKEITLMIDMDSTKNRIAIEQKVKDGLIFSSLRMMNAEQLPEQFQGAYWVNSLFDTNFLFWKKANSSMVERAIIEYDGLCLIYDQSGWFLQKSAHSMDESNGYVGPWISHGEQKISMGTSWSERLVRLLMEAKNQFPELFIFIELLRKI